MTLEATTTTGPLQVLTDGRIPLKVWARDVEPGALEQGINLTNLPGARHHVALMPDAHQGYGMPIGGVLFTEQAVVPNAVGVDIGCGVVLIESSLTMDDLGDRLPAFLAQVARDIPVGNPFRGNGQGQHRKPQGEPFDPGPDVADHMLPILERAEVQLGTLGGGNHFLELQRDEEGRLWFMLHSGSRSVGKQVCDRWHGEALALNTKWASSLPHRELAWLPWDSDEARGYWADMTIALAWAEESRRRMAGKVIYAFGRVLGGEAWQVLDIHHNYATWEHHYGVNGIVHRKGSVRARAGEQVLIPGSMGTASYVGEGLGNPESFMTCQHGAGRARSRAATRKETTLEAMEASLGDVLLVTPDRASVIDESPVAYKDIEDVMSLSSDLVRPVRRHLPVGVVKG